MNWNYKHEEQQFAVLPEGSYRIRVKSAEKSQSSNGNDMLVLQFEVSGNKKILYHYIVFLPENPAVTNGKLTQFFQSFKDIPEGDLDTAHWIGKVGAARIKHEVYNGEAKERISYFIRAEKQGDLPNWVDSDTGMEQLDSGEDLPF